MSGIFPLFSFTNNFTYGKDNLLTKYEIESGKTVTYTYDGLNRLTKTSLSTATPIDTTYSYYNSNRGDGYTTTKLHSETIDGVTYTYEYDTLGNITDIYRGDTHLYYYEYDAMNQLTHVRDYENAKSYSYTYDTAGNIIFEYISDVDSKGSAYNTVHKIYQYNDTNWGDKLTSYDGHTITYDAIGNPLSYRDGMTMTWKNGRQLATLQDSNNTISYEYDSSSVRTSKTIDGVKHTYAYLNGKLMYETRGESKFYYSYDSNGILYSVKYTLTDDSSMQTYFFTHNSRGDIVGIYSDTGVLSAKYEYDAWGNILSVTDSQGNAITDQNHIANLNPFRYRGYYYDNETGLYYLMSRYYDPVTHRFINADGYFQSGGSILDTNMSAYCRNNPISFIDPTGTKCIIHDPYYVGNCTSCNHDYFLFKLDPERKIWFEKIKGINTYTSFESESSKSHMIANTGYYTYGGTRTISNSSNSCISLYSTVSVSNYNYSLGLELGITFHGAYGSSITLFCGNRIGISFESELAPHSTLSIGTYLSLDDCAIGLEWETSEQIGKNTHAYTYSGGGVQIGMQTLAFAYAPAYTPLQFPSPQYLPMLT